MHVYVYDDFVNSKKYESTLSRIETRITDLGLNGRIIRLGAMKNTPVLIENELRSNAKTIVAVGNDKTVNKIVNTILKTQDHSPGLNLALGMIPIGRKNNIIAQGLGIDPEEEACDALSARRLESLSVGSVYSTSLGGQTKQKYFLSHVSIPSQNTTLEIDENFSIEMQSGGEVHILNFDSLKLLPGNMQSDPKDTTLELYIKTKEGGGLLKRNAQVNESIFSFKKLAILNKKHPVTLDNSLEITPPIEIQALKNKLNVIVGKEREF